MYLNSPIDHGIDSKQYECPDCLSHTVVPSASLSVRVVAEKSRPSRKGRRSEHDAVTTRGQIEGERQSLRAVVFEHVPALLVLFIGQFPASVRRPKFLDFGITPAISRDGPVEEECAPQQSR